MGASAERPKALGVLRIQCTRRGVAYVSHYDWQCGTGGRTLPRVGWGRVANHGERIRYFDMKGTDTMRPGGCGSRYLRSSVLSDRDEECGITPEVSRVLRVSNDGRGPHFFVTLEDLMTGSKLVCGAVVVVLLLSGLCAQPPGGWSAWSNQVSYGFGNNGMAFQWIGQGGALAGGFGPGFANGWNLIVNLDIASGLSGGKPTYLVPCVPRQFDNGTRARIRVRVPQVELTTPGVIRPSRVEVEITHHSGTAPVLWRSIELAHVGSVLSNVLFRYRPCFPTPPEVTNGAWGIDGRNTDCLSQVGLSGQSIFAFSSTPVVDVTTVGMPTGPAAGTAAFMIGSNIAFDAMSASIVGALPSTEAYLIASTSLVPGGALNLDYNGSMIVLHVNPDFILGPVPLAMGGGAIGPITLSEVSSFGPFYLQWFSHLPGSPSMVGLSEALCVNVAYHCP